MMMRPRNPCSIRKNKQRYSHDGHTYTDDHDDGDGDDDKTKNGKKPIVRTNKDTANDIHTDYASRLKPRPLISKHFIYYNPVRPPPIQAMPVFWERMVCQPLP